MGTQMAPNNSIIYYLEEVGAGKEGTERLCVQKKKAGAILLNQNI